MCDVVQNDHFRLEEQAIQERVEQCRLSPVCRINEKQIGLRRQGAHSVDDRRIIGIADDLSDEARLRLERQKVVAFGRESMVARSGTG